MARPKVERRTKATPVSKGAGSPAPKKAAPFWLILPLAYVTLSLIVILLETSPISGMMCSFSFGSGDVAGCSRSVFWFTGLIFLLQIILTLPGTLFVGAAGAAGDWLVRVALSAAAYFAAGVLLDLFFGNLAHRNKVEENG